MADTNKFGLPIMTSAQAQKHVTFNEAMIRLEAVSQVSVINTITLTPPASPSDGDSYVIGSVATGVWLGRENDIAVWSNSQWLYATPTEGWLIFDQAQGTHLKWDGIAWVNAFPLSSSGFGWENYQDVTTTASPIDMTLADTWYDLTNDGEGSLTTTTFAPAGVGPLWDDVTNTLDFSTLSVGDDLRIRFDVDVVTSGANHGIDCQIVYGPSYGYSNIFLNTTIKSAGTHKLFMEFSLAMFNVATRDNPAKLQVRSDAAGDDVVVNGWKIAVHRP